MIEVIILGLSICQDIGAVHTPNQKYNNLKTKQNKTTNPQINEQKPQNKNAKTQTEKVKLLIYLLILPSHPRRDFPQVRKGDLNIPSSSGLEDDADRASPSS